MKVNLREIIHYIDESTLEKAKNEKVQKQESPSKMSKDVEESVDKMISNRMSKAYSEWKSNQDTQPFNENIEKEYQKLLETLSPEQEEVLTKYCDPLFRRLGRLCNHLLSADQRKPVCRTVFRNSHCKS